MSGALECANESPPVQVSVLPVTGVESGLRAEMAAVAARYYLRPVEGVDEELRCGDRVYLAKSGSAIGAFLIVDMDHHRASIDGRFHQFTYLGLGCASGVPMAPVFQRVKVDLGERLERGAVGVLHLTTRTPYAIRGIEKAFGGDVFPQATAAGDGDAAPIARHLKSVVHRHAPRSADESPFLLRELKQGRFRDEEIARIRTFRGENPIARFDVDCTGADELIVFHRFAP